ncbi:MAG: hypothetical protein LBR73_01825 [Oscillospiraceae bacterium]|jgi:hypothetical protein|nr:hypothetical protein [Oscillospiraceae bacterium]
MNAPKAKQLIPKAQKVRKTFLAAVLAFTMVLLTALPAFAAANPPLTAAFLSPPTDTTAYVGYALADDSCGAVVEVRGGALAEPIGLLRENSFGVSGGGYLITAVWVIADGSDTASIQPGENILRVRVTVKSKKTGKVLDTCFSEPITFTGIPFKDYADTYGILPLRVGEEVIVPAGEGFAIYEFIPSADGSYAISYNTESYAVRDGNGDVLGYPDALSRKVLYDLADGETYYIEAEKFGTDEPLSITPNPRQLRLLNPGEQSTESFTYNISPEQPALVSLHSLLYTDWAYDDLTVTSVPAGVIKDTSEDWEMLSIPAFGSYAITVTAPDGAAVTADLNAVYVEPDWLAKLSAAWEAFTNIAVCIPFTGAKVYIINIIFELLALPVEFADDVRRFLVSLPETIQAWIDYNADRSAWFGEYQPDLCELWEVIVSKWQEISI